MAPNPSSVGRDRAAFAALLSAAYASAAVALMFLVLDAFRGDPFLTPSLMGSALFLGATPTADLEVRLDMVALYSVVHFLLFALLGAAATLASMRFAPLRQHVLALPAAIFVALITGELLVDLVLLPGLLSTIGLGWVTLANTVAAFVMGRFIRDALGDEDLPSLIDVFLRATGPAS